MLTPEEAQRTILDSIQPLGVERIPLLEAMGRVLAVDIRARYDNPPLDNSAMDGYAVRYADVKDATPHQPAELKIVEDIPAGSVGGKTVNPGQTSRIMTGAPLPPGADTVVRVEDTCSRGPRVLVLESEEENANVRYCGEDIRAGATLLKTGTECGPGELAVLASQQHASVPVFRRPTLAILSTGDELVELGQSLEPGKIVDSNTYALAALARTHHAVPWMLPIVRDREIDIRRAIESVLNADFILSSGGVSVGEHDYVKKVLVDLGAEIGLWRVAMKPGRPLFFCTIHGKPYFGLPGNPVSSVISFLQFVRPAIHKASSYPPNDWLLPTARATMDHHLHNGGNRRHYLRARLRYDSGRLCATAHQRQGSHMLSSMLDTNGLVILNPEEKVQAGEEAEVQIIGRLF
jgi:molybdopterin molybdotransferase